MTNAVTRVVQCHLKDCSNLLAIYDKQRVLWTNFINPDPHVTSKCLFWKPIINLIGIYNNSHLFQHKTAFYWGVFFITYSTFKSLITQTVKYPVLKSVTLKTLREVRRNIHNHDLYWNKEAFSKL